MITAQQNKALHAMLGKQNLMAHKADLISSFTEGRTTSSKDLNHIEVIEIMRWLQGNDAKEIAGDAMRKKIIAMAREMGWSIPHPTKPGATKANMERVNDWCVKYGFLKKRLNSYAYAELPKLVSQFEKVYESFLKSV